MLSCHGQTCRTQRWKVSIKPGKCSLGRAGHGEALWERSLASAAARMGQRWAKPAKAWLRTEGWVQTFPFPSKVFVFIFSAQRAALPWQVIFCLPPTSCLCWIQADEGLRTLSQRGRGNHSHQNICHSPGSSLLLHSPQRRFSPLLSPDSLGAAWFTSYGDLDGDW